MHTAPFTLKPLFTHRQPQCSTACHVHRSSYADQFELADRCWRLSSTIPVQPSQARGPISAMRCFRVSWVRPVKAVGSTTCGLAALWMGGLHFFIDSFHLVIMTFLNVMLATPRRARQTQEKEHENEDHQHPCPSAHSVPDRHHPYLDQQPETYIQESMIWYVLLHIFGT